MPDLSFTLNSFRHLYGDTYGTLTAPLPSEAPTEIRLGLFGIQLRPAPHIFETVLSPDIGSTIDRLIRTLNDPTGSSNNIDNIVVSPIPEPSTALLAYGFAAGGL